MYEAERQTGVNVNEIKTCCEHKFETGGGFQWIYVGDTPPVAIKTKHFKQVCQFRMDGKYIRTFGSLHIAERYLGLSRAKISLCCKGERESYGGYKFKFLYDTDLEIPDEEIIKTIPHVPVAVPSKKMFEKIRLARIAEQNKIEREKARKSKARLKEKEKEKKIKAKEREKQKKVKAKLAKEAEKIRKQIEEQKPSCLLKKYYAKHPEFKTEMCHKITKKETELKEAIKHEDRVVVIKDDKIYKIYNNKAEAKQELNTAHQVMAKSLYEFEFNADRHGYIYKFYYMVDKELIDEFYAKENDNNH